MRELRIELCHRGDPFESIQKLLKVFGSIQLETIPESWEDLHDAIATAIALDAKANPSGYAGFVARRSVWELLIATPANVLIMLDVNKIDVRFGRDSVELSRQLIQIAQECGCPTWADGVSV